MADPSDAESSASIEPIDFESASGLRLPFSLRTLGFLGSMAALAAIAAYESLVIPHTIPPWGFDTTRMGYLLYGSLLVLVFYLVIPLARRPALLRRYWWQLRSRYLALVSIAWLAVFFFLGTFGPGLVDRYRIGYVDLPHGPPMAQPPAWERIPYGADLRAGQALNCLGPVQDGYCHGTWHFPLGTTRWGADVIDLIVDGFRVALEISMVTAMLIVPIALVVGTTAAYYGGWIDELLMRYVDVQLVVPALFLVILVQQLFGRNNFHIVLVFGLLNWGGTARIVRAEALQRVEEGYVKAAESAGASSFSVLYRHVMPNVSNTIVTAVTLQMPTLIFAEATISFLDFGSPTANSWGTTIGSGLVTFPDLWWTATFAAVPLILTALAFHVLGDALREVVDPRTEEMR